MYANFKINNRYLTCEVLGKGAFGEVWSATDSLTN